MEPCLCCSDVGAGHRFKSLRGLLWEGVSLNDRTVWMHCNKITTLQNEHPGLATGCGRIARACVPKDVGVSLMTSASDGIILPMYSCEPGTEGYDDFQSGLLDHSL